MKIENTTTVTNEILVNKFIETSVKTLDGARREREMYLSEMGDTLNKTGDSEQIRILNGHRAIISYSFKTIRETVGLSLGDMTYKCDVGLEEIEECERTGFLDFYGNSCSLDDSDTDFIRGIYVAWLKRRIMFLEIDFFKNPLKYILEFSSTALADIDREVIEFNGLLDFNYVDSLEYVKESYKIINDILEPFRTF